MTRRSYPACYVMYLDYDRSVAVSQLRGFRYDIEIRVCHRACWTYLHTSAKPRWMDLHTRITQLSEQFAANILAALKTASLDELLREQREVRASTPPRATGRLGRRSPDDLSQLADKILAIVARHPDGIRAEDIRVAVGIEAKELARPIAMLLTDGRLTKTGQKRATVYKAKKRRG